MSAGLIAANLFGGSARTTSPVAPTYPASTVTLEQIEDTTEVLPESILTSLEEEADTSVEADVEKTEVSPEEAVGVVTKEEVKEEIAAGTEEITAEETAEFTEEKIEEQQLGEKATAVESSSETLTETKEEVSLAPKQEEPANVFESLMKKMESAGQAGSEKAEATKEEAQSIIEKEDLTPLEEPVETPKPEEPANVLESLMKRMEAAGQAGSEKAETIKEEVQTVVETEAAKPTEENVEALPKPEELTNVFESLMKRMEAAGQAGSEKIEAAKEEIQSVVEKESAPKVSEPVDVFEGLMKKVESKGQTGSEKADQLVSPLANVNLPDNLGSTLINGAAIAAGGAIGVSLVAASRRGRSTSRTGAAPKSDTYLDGLTRSSSTLSKKSAPSGYLDRLKSPPQAILKTSGQSMGSAYLNAISKDSGALPNKSYSFANKKPGKTSVNSSSPVAKITPSVNFKTAPTLSPVTRVKVDAPRTETNMVKESLKTEIRPAKVPAEELPRKEPENVTPSSPAPGPVSFSYIESRPASSTPPKTSYGPNKSYRVPSGGMGSSAGYLSNIADPSSSKSSNTLNGVNGSPQSTSKGAFSSTKGTRTDSKGSYLSGLTGDPVDSSYTPFKSSMSKSGDYGPRGYLDDL